MKIPKQRRHLPPSKDQGEYNQAITPSDVCSQFIAAIDVLRDNIALSWPPEELLAGVNELANARGAMERFRKLCDAHWERGLAELDKAN